MLEPAILTGGYGKDINPDSTLLILSADHYMGGREAFIETLEIERNWNRVDSNHRPPPYQGGFILKLTTPSILALVPDSFSTCFRAENQKKRAVKMTALLIYRQLLIKLKRHTG